MVLSLLNPCALQPNLRHHSRVSLTLAQLTTTLSPGALVQQLVEMELNQELCLVSTHLPEHLLPSPIVLVVLQAALVLAMTVHAWFLLGLL